VCLGRRKGARVRGICGIVSEGVRSGRDMSAYSSQKAMTCLMVRQFESFTWVVGRRTLSVSQSFFKVLTSSFVTVTFSQPANCQASISGGSSYIVHRNLESRVLVRVLLYSRVKVIGNSQLK